jgi:hypothetical protein
MDGSQLQLENYFFAHQEVRANPAHDPKGNRKGSRVDLSYVVSPIDLGLGAYGIEVTVSLNEAESENPPYFFRISAFARVSVQPATSVSTELVAVNSLNILIGAIRERLATLTARGPWGPFFLNAMALRAEMSDSDELPTEQASENQ